MTVAQYNNAVVILKDVIANELADYSYEDNQWIQTPYTLESIATICNGIVKKDDVICVNGIDVYMVGYSSGINQLWEPLAFEELSDEYQAKVLSK